jgi:hypothetical protein
MLPASIVAAQAATDGAAQSHHHALDDTHLDMEENGLHKMAAFLAAPAAPDWRRRPGSQPRDHRL